MKRLSIIITLVLTFVAGMRAAKSVPDYKNSALPVERRVADLMSRMTLDEKIGQMNQTVSAENVKDMAHHADMVRRGEVGSFMNVYNAPLADSLQRVALYESRLGIPILFGRDVIHGYKTIFPIPLGQASTFNPDIARDGARIAALEASSDGVNWTFAPMIDIARDPRWGRIAEGCGEDPLLTSLMAVAMVNGFQGDDPSAPGSVAACAKHFVGYGAAEGGRDYNSTALTERQLRQTYFPPFKAAVDAGVLTFMSSFNDNDGIPCSGNRWLLTDVLRDEWGFDGFVVSDCFSVTEMITHGFAVDRRDATCQAVNAGLAMDMVTNAYLENLHSLVDESKVTEAQIDSCVAGILKVKFALGLFENPYVRTPQSVKYHPDHLKAAHKAALQSAILLKNDSNLLPVGPGVKRILLTGPLADARYDQLGTWIFDGEKSHTVTIYDALKAECDTRGITLDFVPALKYTRHDNPQGLADAAQAARQADLIIAAVGEEAIFSGEGHCMASLNLVGLQTALLDSLAATGKPLATIVMAGRPLTIKRQLDQSDAMLYSFHPGTMGGSALADLIMGNESPSGRLPVTFPLAVGQIPLYYNHTNTGRPATGKEIGLDGIPEDAGNTFLGCTSYYLDVPYTPLFPFGYGLTYGKFSYSNLSLDADSYAPDGTINVSFTLTNDGDREATEVAQVYVRDHTASVTRPVRELKAFRRITLAPHTSTIVTLAVPVTDLAFITRDMTLRTEPGHHTLYVGPDANATLSADFTID